MKKSISLFLAVLLLLALTACAMETRPANTNAAAGQQNNNAVNAWTPGKLHYIGLKDGEQPLLRGLRLSGNRAGKTVNERDPGTEGIRSAFEMNEKVEFYPDVDDGAEMKVYVLRHRDTPNAYNNATLSETTPGYVHSFELSKDPGLPDGWSWESFYLDPEKAEPGDYDIVFTSKGKTVAVLPTRFYPEGKLADKSDSELEKLMNDWSAQTAW